MLVTRPACRGAHTCCRSDELRGGVLPHHKLIVFGVACELIVAVQKAGIADAKLRDEALRVMDIVKAKNADALFEAGSRLDRVCENCHLEYWYPGDKAAVLEDEQKRATLPGQRTKK